MSDPGLALQVALIEAIEGVVSVPVWDAVPQDSDYPYIVIDSTNVANTDYLSARQDLRFVYVSVWSRKYGQAEVLEIMGQIDQLNNVHLQLATGEMSSLRIERKRTVREPDNLTFMGQVTLRIFTLH